MPLPHFRRVRLWIPGMYLSSKGKEGQVHHYYFILSLGLISHTMLFYLRRRQRLP